MTAKQTSPARTTMISGGVLLIAGLLVLFAYGLQADAWWNSVMVRFGADSFGIFPALGLASLSLVHRIAFNPTSLAAWTAHFLVSFWPLLPIAVGLHLLRKNPAQIQQVCAADAGVKK